MVQGPGVPRQGTWDDDAGSPRKVATVRWQQQGINRQQKKKKKKKRGGKVDEQVRERWRERRNGRREKGNGLRKNNDTTTHRTQFINLFL